jgi:nucleotide-binding universal stress UspA family protein
VEVVRMAEFHSPQTAYLAFDDLTLNPRLARRLSRDLAWRFHALPVAEENGRVTVAMANPADAEARDAVVAALGPQSCCVVQSDPKTIDTLLAAIWSEEIKHHMDVLVYAFPSTEAEGLQTYARRVADLLDARVSCVNASGALDALTREGDCARQGLVILSEPDSSLVRHLMSPPADALVSAPSGELHFGVLVARRPRWPLKQILLVIQDAGRHEAAVEWAVRLAGPSGSEVTVLVVVPPVPAMHRGLARMEQGLPSLLSTDTSLGKKLRQVAKQLVDWEVKSTLRMRQGPPDWEIRREVVEADYDLIAVTANPRHRWLQLPEDDVSTRLFRWAERPVLVVKPTSP